MPCLPPKEHGQFCSLGFLTDGCGILGILTCDLPAIAQILLFPLGSYEENPSQKLAFSVVFLLFFFYCFLLFRVIVERVCTAHA